MMLNQIRKPAAIVIIALIFSSCKKEPRCHDGNNHFVSTKVFATGFNSPRGLKFGPDGQLYVAESGLGGTNSTAGECGQVDPPAGPYTGSLTSGRISKVDHWGTRSTITDQLPSAISTGGEIVGVADVAFIGNNLYAVLAGGGCSHGNPSVPNGIVKVAHNGSWTLIANLSQFVKDNETAHPEVGSGEPDGGFYSLENYHGSLYTVEANHGQILKVTQDGNVSRLIDISASQGHIVPTSIQERNGNFFVGNLNVFPITEGSSNIYKISPAGVIEIWATGFTTVLGATFDREGRLYVLENTTGNLFPTPGTGKIIRVDKSGNKKTIVAGLDFPTAITYGPDEKLYVSNKGFGPASTGGGEVVQVRLKDCRGDDLEVDESTTK